MLITTVLRLVVAGQGNGQTPHKLRKGQWRSDNAVVHGFQVDILHADAVTNAEAVMDMSCLLPQAPRCVPAGHDDLDTPTVVCAATRALAASVRRAAAADASIPLPVLPLESLFDPTLFPPSLFLAVVDLPIPEQSPT